MKDYCWYYAGCVVIIALGIVMIIMACRLYNSDVTLYDVEIKVHYIDGYSEIIREDSISCNSLPTIVEGTRTMYCGSRVFHTERLGTYSLYFGDKKYPAVIRFEYLKKREYKVPYKELYAY